jgi:hypothetical protein
MIIVPMIKPPMIVAISMKMMMEHNMLFPIYDTFNNKSTGDAVFCPS